MLPFALLLLAAAPTHARFVLSLADTPTAEVSFSLEKSRYAYTATHVFRSKQATFHRTLELGPDGTVDGRVPEVWWLSTQRPVGCTAALEERTLSAEQVCVTAATATSATGTIAGKPFRAEYVSDGTLGSLTVGEARFDASSLPLDTSVDPFAGGFPVDGTSGTPRLVPTAPATVERVTPMRFEPREDESCLDVAKRAVAEKRAQRVVLGVVLEGGRAWPHAWVQLRDGDQQDPTALDGVNRMYLAFPRDAGRRYLELLGGTRRIVLGKAR